MISITESTKDMETAKGKVERRKGDLLNKRKFAQLLNDYVAFKRKYVRHFQYDAKAESTSFGINIKILHYCSYIL